MTDEVPSPARVDVEISSNSFHPLEQVFFDTLLESGPHVKYLDTHRFATQIEKDLLRLPGPARMEIIHDVPAVLHEEVVRLKTLFAEHKAAFDAATVAFYERPDIVALMQARTSGARRTFPRGPQLGQFTTEENEERKLRGLTAFTMHVIDHVDDDAIKAEVGLARGTSIANLVSEGQMYFLEMLQEGRTADIRGLRTIAISVLPEETNIAVRLRKHEFADAIKDQQLSVEDLKAMSISDLPIHPGVRQLYLSRGIKTLEDACGAEFEQWIHGELRWRLKDETNYMRRLVGLQPIY